MPARERGAIVKQLRAVLPWTALNEGQRIRLENFLSELVAWLPGAPLTNPLDYLLRNALAVWPALRAGRAEVVIDRKKCDSDRRRVRPWSPLFGLWWGRSSREI